MLHLHKGPFTEVQSDTVAALEMLRAPFTEARSIMGTHPLPPTPRHLFTQAQAILDISRAMIMITLTRAPLTRVPTIQVLPTLRLRIPVRATLLPIPAR